MHCGWRHDITTACRLPESEEKEQRSRNVDCIARNTQENETAWEDMWVAIAATAVAGAVLLYRHKVSANTPTASGDEGLRSSSQDDIRADKSGREEATVPVNNEESVRDLSFGEEAPSPPSSAARADLDAVSSPRIEGPQIVVLLSPKIVSNGTAEELGEKKIVTKASTASPPPRPTIKPPNVPPLSTDMGPPPRPHPTTTTMNGSALRPPPSAASSLRVPPQKALSNTSMQPRASSTLLGAAIQKNSKRVRLSPGHSPLDWAALTSSSSSAPSISTRLRGKDAPAATLTKISAAQLKAQNGRKGRDAWTSYAGKVYNLSAYLDFHPGGVGEMMKGAGRESDGLFMEVHPWVNWDSMLGECLLGVLVRDGEVENRLDEMD